MAGLAIIIMLAGLELILRWRGVFSTDVNVYDQETGLFTKKPNSEILISNDCFENIEKNNSQGFHDSEFTLAKPDDVFRIAVLGDSFVEAQQVQVEKTFYYLLEQKLNELPTNKKKIEVYAFGMGGNSTFKNYLYLNQYALKYQPDLVILGFLAMNDFREDYGLLPQIFDKQGNIKTKPSGGQRLISKSVLFLWADYQWKLVKTRFGYIFRNIFLPKGAVSQLPFDFQVFLKEYPENWNKVWDLEEKLLREFKLKSEASGAKFLLVSFDDIWRAHPEILKENKEYGKYLTNFDLDFDKPEKILADFSQKEGINYLNLVPLLRERIKTENQMTFYYPCDNHWNEIGHLWAGEAIFQYLDQKSELIDN